MMKGKGFTLLELLVAMAISGIIFLILSLSLRAGLGAVERGKKDTLLEQEVWGVRGLIQRQLLNAYLDSVVYDGKKVGFFQGKEDQITFITLAPVESLTPGGTSVVAYWLEGKDLYFAQWPYLRKEDLKEGLEKEKEERILLAKGIDKFSVKFLTKISYHSGEGFDEEWKDKWEPQGHFPLGIQVDVKKGRYETSVFVSLGR